MVCSNQGLIWDIVNQIRYQFDFISRDFGLEENDIQNKKKLFDLIYPGNGNSWDSDLLSSQL